MKIGWLVWDYEDDEFPKLKDCKPDWCFRAIQIVYAEVIEGQP
jgi:hypothetical protein